ncbi:MAG: Smr/MutS family protein [Muribaculaceae bacterium]|nr:Smr/MutS family protein [Muribaculaceae bacterium]
MIYPSNFETKIGFDTVRRELERYCVSALGAANVPRLRFSTRRDEVVRWLEETNEFLSIVQTGKEFPLSYYFDLRVVLKEVATPGTFLSAERLFDLQRLLVTVSQVVRFFATEAEGGTPYPRLRELTSGLQAFPELSNAIGHVLDKAGNIKDTASPQLQDLRSTIARVTSSINGTLRHIIAQGKQDGILDNDVQPSLRDGRLVLPVSAMNKRKLHGIVHDESATGKTVFIEPDAIVEANNRIRETEAEIAREIIRILTAVTDQIRPHLDELSGVLETLGQLDFIRAKALFAQDVGAQMCHIDRKPVVEWYNALHPSLLLSLRSQGKEVVPLNITLNRQDRILVISGPNAGGKSVCLKTVGVVQYMMQCGLLPTLRDNSHMGLYRDIFIDIGDQQSIENDLSTYSSHLQNMKMFLSKGGKETLILIDEMGSGTEPQIGGAIAQSILEQLNEHQVMGVVTTHYQNLKHFAEETAGVVNGAMLYDRQRMQPLFQLSMGYPGSSFAIEIARKTGLPQQVIDKASEIVGSDYINMDKYLLDIVRDRRYWENKRQDVRAKEKRLDQLIADYDERLDGIRAEHRQIIHDARAEAQEILRGSNAQIEKTIKEIREQQAEKERTKELRRQLDEFKKRLNDLEPEEPSRLKELAPKEKPRRKTSKKSTPKPVVKDRPLQAGDNVVLKGSTTVGTLISIDEKYALVAFGNIKTRIEANMVERTMRKEKLPKPESLGRVTTDEIRNRQLNFKPDIDVRGMRADEALQAITYFIDDAIQFSAQRVRILHGTGTGALKVAIREYLQSVNGVKSYRDEHVQFGGAGITVVELE